MDKIKCIHCGISITIQKDRDDLSDEEMSCNKCYEEIYEGKLLNYG